MKKTHLLLLCSALLILSGCSEKISFKKGDIKDDFCGPHINFQYCKCAFHGEYCDAIGMKRGEAKKHVNEKYDEWIDQTFGEFKEKCKKDNGIIKGKSCVYCDLEEEATNNKCVAISENKEEKGDEDEEEAEEDETVEEKGECKYDNECPAICEGNVMWKMGCNPRENKCIKVRDIDCLAEIENFGELDFPKVCQAGACVRDEASINAIRSELTSEKAVWSKAVKDINASRESMKNLMMDANKNCINGIADMTNLAIVEFATRVGSVLAGGIPDIAKMTASAAKTASGLLQEHTKNLANTAVDYTGDALNRLNNYAQGQPTEEEKKLKPHEYIKLNCDLYNFFKDALASSDTDLETALENAREVDAMLDALP